MREPDAEYGEAIKMESNQKLEVSVSQLHGTMIELGAKAITALGAILIYSIVQLVRLGNQGDYLLLLIGSLASVVAIMGYIFMLEDRAAIAIREQTSGKRGLLRSEKGFTKMILAFGGFIPWAFGSYVVFVSGFWSLKNLADGFSTIVIIKATLSIVLGYAVVSSFSKITEVGRGISEGAFAIQDKRP